MLQFADPVASSHAAATRILPSDRVLPSVAAEATLRTADGPYDFDLAPMMREPLNELAGRRYQGIVFVGPQRSSKTSALILGGLCYVVTASPGDTLLVHVSRDSARTFSQQDLSRAIAASPKLAAAMSPSSRDDNLLDKRFRSGMDLHLGWPTATQLAGRSVRYVFLTDYDRPENRDNVDGQGPLWDMALKRVETYMSRGKCLAESSPGDDVVDGAWRAPDSAPHMAPPARGIISVYNTGSRGRWYWRCRHCGEWMQCAPGYDLFRLPTVERLIDLVREHGVEPLVERYAIVPCPTCAVIHTQEDKAALNLSGRWLHEGERFEGDAIVGDRRRSNIWSGWMGGAGASFQRWDSLLRNYLQAVERYAAIGDEAPMRMVSLSDVALPYTPMAMRSKRTAKKIAERAEIWGERTLPVGVRFLTAAADVQSSRFVVQVHGWGEGLEQWIIDRYDLSSSDRPEGDRYAAVQPASYLEDWSVLEAVISREYRFASGAVLRPLVMMVDSGGRAGVTANAYAWWRSLAKKGQSQRIQLVRGDGRLKAARIRRTLPDSSKRSDRRSGAKGDVPVWMVNTNMLKDQLAGDLDRPSGGIASLHIPEWIASKMPDVLEELVAETRTDKGWRNPASKRNEATDLAVYNRGAMLAIGGERIEWENPPSWAVVPVAGATVTARRRRPRINSPGASY